MKKIFLSLAAIASFGAANAQKMGDVFVYGNIGYTDVKNEVSGSGIPTTTTSHERTFNFAPGIGYQFDRNWAIGLSGNFEAMKNTVPATGGETGTKQSLTYVGPFVRYTQPLSPMFFLYGQLNAQYVRANYTELTAGVKTGELEGNGFAVNVMPALGINVSRSIAVVGSFGKLGYSRVKLNAPTGGSDLIASGIDATFGSNFTLGIQWNLGGRGRMRTRREPMGETRSMDRYRDNEGDTKEEMPTPPPAPRRRMRRN
ncbi:MAG: porin family protein [Sphingobacteriales bacterium]|nr:MAG: porin family protein [Sphingobacteriales bacterium]